jgi:hypothetical protein
MDDDYTVGLGWREIHLLADKLEALARELRKAPEWIQDVGEYPTLEDLVVVQMESVSSMFVGGDGDAGEQWRSGPYYVRTLEEVVRARAEA